MTTSSNQTPKLDSIEQLDDKTAESVYALLGRRNDELTAMVEEFEERGLDHLEACDMVEQRAARFRKMRGILQSATDTPLGSDEDAIDETEVIINE